MWRGFFGFVFDESLNFLGLAEFFVFLFEFNALCFGFVWIFILLFKFCLKFILNFDLPC